MIYRKSRRLMLAFFGSLLLTIHCGDGFEQEPTTDAGNHSDAGSSEVDGLIESDADVGTSGGPYQLEPGEAVEIPLNDGLGAASFATVGDEAFMLILVSTHVDGDAATYDYELVIGDQTTDNVGITPVTECSLTDSAWRDVLPEPESLPSGEPPEAGDEREFVVPTDFFSERIDARVLAVGTGAVVWADITDDHPAELESEFVEEFLADFDAIILPRLRSIFGIESDIDDNGRIHIVFSPLTYETAVAFFSPCDLTPTDCEISNEAELLYLTPPNAIDPPYNTPNAIKEILAHELQHLIHFNRSALLNDLNETIDNAYVHEGLGALAQDVSGYQAGNFYVTKAGLEEIDVFSLRDILPDRGSYDRDRDGALRGGAYLFTRWLYDRAGGDEAMPDGSVENRGGPALIRALMEAPESAATALPELTGSSTEELAMDFYTAVGVSNRDVVEDSAPTNPCFQYLETVSDPITDRQRGANLFASFHGQAMEGPATQLADSPDGSLLAGGVDLLVLEAEEGETETGFSIDVHPDAQARLRIVRIR